jgi:tetratricopeptide (TPR) repeat protein
MFVVFTAFLLSALAFAQEKPADAWPDDRTARMIDRYLDVLKRRPAEGEVFRSLAGLYDAAGRLDDLAARLDRAGVDEPAGDWPELLRGHLERYRMNAAAALPHYEKAAGRRPKGYLAPLMIARTCEDLGRWEEAEKSYAAALDAVADAAAVGLDAGDETRSVYRALGRVALTRGRADDARKYWDKLVELDPQNLSRREELAKLLAENNLFDDAIRAYEKIVEMSADDPVRRATAWRDIGGVREKAGKPDEAMDAYRKALSLTAPGNWLRHDVNERIFRLAESRGKLAELEAELAGRAAAAPDDAENWRGLARVRQKLGLGAGVSECFSRLVRLRPDDVDVRREQASQLLELGAWKDAADALRELVARDPKASKPRFELAETLGRLGRRDEALATWKRLATDFASDPGVQLQLARVLEGEGETDLAAAAYAGAVKAKPDETKFRRELGEFEFRRGRADEAKAAWRAMAGTRPTAPDAWTELAEVFRQHGMMDDALAAGLEAVKLAPKSAERLRDLARLYVEMKRPAAAAAAWEKFAEAADSDAKRDEAWEQILTIYSSTDRLETLLEEYRLRAAKNPGDIRMGHRLGMIMERLGDVDGAQALYERYLADHPDDRACLLSLARLYRHEEEKQKAAPVYEKLVELDRLNARTYLTELIACYLDAGRPEDALKSAKRLAQAYPLDASAHVELARVLESLGRYEEAVAALMQATKLRPDDYSLVQSLARVYEASGDLERLIELHRQAARSSANAFAYLDSVRSLVDLTYGTPGFKSLEPSLVQRLAQNRRELAYWRALAEFYLADERPDAVKQLYRDAVDAVGANERGEALLALSKHCADMGDLDEAIRSCEELRASSRPVSPDTLIYMAELYLGAGRTADGRRTLKEWWSRDEQNPDVHRTAAETFLRYDDVEAGVESLGRLLALPSRLPDAEGVLEKHEIRLRMAELSERINRTDEAEKLFFTILDHPADVSRHAGAAPARTGGWWRARASLGGAAAPIGAGISPGPLSVPPPPMPSQGPTYQELAEKSLEGLLRIHAERGTEDLARAFEERIAREPGRGFWYRALARLYERTGDMTKMCAVLTRARTRFPQSADWAEYLASARRQQGKLEEALAEYRAARELAPERETRYLDGIIELSLTLKRPEEVWADVKRLLASGGESTSTLTGVAEKCAEMGFPDLAARTLDAAMKRPGPAASTHRLELVAYLRSAGKADEACANIKRYVEETRTRLGTGQLESATLSARRDLFKKLWIYTTPADRERLRRDLEQEASGKGDVTPALIDLAALLKKMGRAEDELATLERILKATSDAGFAERVLDAWRTCGKIDAFGSARLFTERVLASRALYRGSLGSFALAALEGLPGLRADDRLAASLIELALKEDPSAQTRLRVADFYWSAGESDKAIAVLDEQARQDPPDVTVLLRLADYCEGMNRHDDAVEWARRAAEEVEVPADVPETDDQESLYEMRSRQLGELVQRFAERGFAGVLPPRFNGLIDESPDDRLRYYDLAIAEEANGDRTRALEALERFEKLNPDDADASLAIAQVLQRQGREAEAVARLDRLVKSPVPPKKRQRFYEALANAYFRAGERDAELRLRERTALVTRRPDALGDVAREYRNLNRNDRALVTFKKYMRLKYGPATVYGALYGGDASPVQEYSQFLRQLGRHEEAARVCDRALVAARLRGHSGEALAALTDELAQDYQALGRLDELVRRYETKLAANPQDAATLDFLAELYAKSHRSGRETDARRRLAKLRPGDLNTLNRLAQSLREATLLDESIAAYRKMLELNPSGAAGYLRPIAEMYYEKGDTTKAVETAEMLLSERWVPAQSQDERLESAVSLFGLFGLRDREEEMYRRLFDRMKEDAPYVYVSYIQALLARDKVEEACAVGVRGLGRMTHEYKRAQILDALTSTRIRDAGRLVRIASCLERSDLVRSEPELRREIDLRLHRRLVDLGRPELAAGFALRAWRTGPEDRDSGAAAAEELESLGLMGEAADFLREVLFYHPRSAGITLELARLGRMTGGAGGDDPALATLVRRDPRFEIRLRVGQLLMQAGDVGRALPCFEDARRLAPDNPDVAAALAEACVLSGNAAQGEKLWDDVLAAHRTDSVASAAGDFFVALGDVERARKCFAEAVRLNPSAGALSTRLCDVLLEMREYAQCEALCRKAVEAFPERPIATDFERRLRRLDREMNRTEEASAEAERALSEADAGWTKLSLELGAKLEEEKRPGEAADVYRKVVEVSRDSAAREAAQARLKAIEGGEKK